MATIINLADHRKAQPKRDADFVDFLRKERAEWLRREWAMPASPNPIDAIRGMAAIADIWGGDA